jgi:hypothetical protein
MEICFEIMSSLNVLTITAILSGACGASAQTNSWTKPGSGLWHEPFWSLGVLPDATQSHIMFTNAGWKALAIDSVTARDFPASMDIPRLTVASPTNTMNTLLLNYAGAQSPLRVAGDFILGSNSVLLTLSSALEVGQDFRIDGAVNHGDNSLVSASVVYVGDTSPGTYNFSNGTVQAGNIIVGDGTIGSFHQSGGQLSVSSQLRLGLGDRFTSFEGTGRFELTAGILTASTTQIGEHNGRLGPAGADGAFVQSGGSNFAGGLLLGWPESDASSGNEYTYTLHDGLLVTSNTFVYGGNGHFAQAGGLHQVDGPLAVAGFYGRSFTHFDAQYTLSGGVVTARSLNIDFGAMSQSAGTNQISGDLVIGLKDAFSPRSFYNLNGGTLSTSNTFIDSANGSFRQNSGAHGIDNLLEITGFAERGGAGYSLSAGELSVKDIVVSANAVFRHTGGTLSHSGTLILASGTWESAPGEQRFGVLKLASNTNSNLLTNSPTVIRYANSAAAPWDVAATLLVHNWQGSTNGNGSHRIIFGSNETGLTSQQLAQIRFRNPAGLPAADYAATILNTGEIVPLEPTGRGPAISYQRSVGQLRMEWPAGYTLQTSTNITGPFEDVNATSPHSVDTTSDPRRFFRFRADQ